MTRMNIFSFTESFNLRKMCRENTRNRHFLPGMGNRHSRVFHVKSSGAMLWKNSVGEAWNTDTYYFLSIWYLFRGWGNAVKHLLKPKKLPKLVPIAFSCTTLWSRPPNAVENHPCSNLRPWSMIILRSSLGIFLPMAVTSVVNASATCLQVTVFLVFINRALEDWDLEQQLI